MMSYYDETLKAACSMCESYAGEEHDHSECDCPVYTLYQEAERYRRKDGWSDYPSTAFTEEGDAVITGMDGI